MDATLLLVALLLLQMDVASGNVTTIADDGMHQLRLLRDLLEPGRFVQNAQF